MIVKSDMKLVFTVSSFIGFIYLYTHM